MSRSVGTPEELPSSPHYAMIWRPKSDGQTSPVCVYLIACDLEQATAMVAEAHAYSPLFRTRVHTGKPTLNPRKRYERTSGADFFYNPRRRRPGFPQGAVDASRSDCPRGAVR